MIIANNKKIFLMMAITVFAFLFVFSATTVNGESTFTPLSPIKGVVEKGSVPDPAEYFNSMYRFGIIIAAFLAVIMIIIGGFKYMSTDSVSGKGEGREMIMFAVFGLLLILFSYILLKVINPDILEFNLFK